MSGVGTYQANGPHMKANTHKALNRRIIPSHALEERIDDLRVSHHSLVGSLDEAAGLADVSVQSSPRRKRRLDATSSMSLSSGLTSRKASVRHRINIDTLSKPNLDTCVGPRGKCKKQITSEEDFVCWLVKEISKAVHSDAKRHTNYFFNIVLGGNVHLVKSVLYYLKIKRMDTELAWILGTDFVQEDAEYCSASRKLLNWLLFFIWVLLFIVLTPVFYTFHVIIFSAHLATRGRMSQMVDLPIVFAVLSEDPEMVSVILTAGCQIHSQDSEGNNVYHYLADLSQDKPEKAVRCHYALCASVDNLDVLRALITEQTNEVNITALEAIAKYGSMHFLRIIMLDRSCIGNLRLSVSKNTLWADVPEHTFNISGNDSISRDSSEGYCSDSTLDVLEFDISNYEKGDIFSRQSYLLQLIGSRSVESMKEVDIWSMIQSKLVEKWISYKLKRYWSACMLGHVLYVTVTVLLLAYLVNHGGDMNQSPLKDRYDKYDTDLYIKAGKMAMESAASPKDAQHNGTMWDDTCIGWEVMWDSDYRNMFKDLEMYIDNCSATALSMVLDDCNLEPQSLVNMMKESGTPTNKLITSTIACIINVILIGQVCVDLVIREGFLFANFNFKASTIVKSFLPVLIRRYPGSYTEKHLSALLYTSYAAFTTYGVIWNQALIERDNLAVEFMESLNIFFAHQADPHQNETIHIGERLQDQMEVVENKFSIMSNLMIICLMLRFLHTVHSLRLFPGVGFFIITTKKMAKHLLQFAIVFIIVAMSFATIFYFVMRQEICPALKIEGFESLATSLFSTYQVALGYGEYKFTNNLNARIAYMSYTIMTILLLLNLVIAVMTTTAEELNQMPWREALCRLEQWDEILGVEVTVRTLKAPVRLLYRSLKACFNLVCRRTGPAWSDIRRTERKTIEVTFLK